MAGSRTTKRRPSRHELQQRAEKQAAIEVMTNVMMGLLDHWSKEELTRLSSNGTLVCIQTGKNNYRIGQYNLQRHPIGWHVQHYHGHDAQDFFNKQAAVFYCLYCSRNKYHTAREFLLEDQNLGLLQSELDMLYQQLKLAVERKDEWKQDLYLARLSWTKPQFEYARDNLQKKVNSAKYSKVWENKT
jgi:hypothetical protein